MRELLDLIPDVDVLLRLEAEELGTTLLMIIRSRQPANGMVHRGNSLVEVFAGVGEQTGYPLQRRSDIELAIAEAWNWLEVQGLLVPAPDTNGQNGYRVLSRRAQRLETADDVRRYSAGRHLPKETLHPSIRETVWGAFIRGEFDVAVFQAMKAVEVAVKNACPDLSSIGVTLMRNAFAPNTGPLTDLDTSFPEQEARSALFAGAIGAYKNPQSHRDVDLEDPQEALEIVLLANHLLRIIDARVSSG